MSAQVLLEGLLYFAIPDRENISVVLCEQWFSYGGYDLTPRLGNAILREETSSDRCIYSRVDLLERNSGLSEKAHNISSQLLIHKLKLQYKILPQQL